MSASSEEAVDPESTGTVTSHPVATCDQARADYMKDVPFGD